MPECKLNMFLKLLPVLALPLLLSATMLGVIAHAAPLTDPAPTIIAISPTAADNADATVIVITGTAFTAVPTLTIGIADLLDVHFVSGTLLSATVPAGLPGGIYTLTVTNPDGQSNSLVNALTLMQGGEGSLGAWESITPMIFARQAPGFAVAGNYVYIIGGYVDSSAGEVSSVERAGINSDGSLGPWQLMSSMNTPREDLAAVAVGNNLYALGGSGGIANVERTTINPDGSLGAWQATTPMNSPRRSLAAVTANGYIYAIAGGVGESSNTVERVKVNPDGSLGAWESATPMQVARTGPAAVVIGGYLYVIGGADGSELLVSVERAAINPDGTLGAWTYMPFILTPRAGLAAVANNGYLYALGGGNSSVHLSQVDFTQINPDGSLAPWEPTTAMSRTGSGIGVLAANNYVYVIGGAIGYGLGSVNEVDRAAIQGVSIKSVSPTMVVADGPTDITITGTNFTLTSTLRLGGNITLTVTFVASTTLTATVPAGLASGWYSLTVDNPGGKSSSLPHALLVDGVPPTGSFVINGGIAYVPSPTVTLALSATDLWSGVVAMAISNDGNSLDTFVPYASTIPWILAPGDGTKTVFARFRDRVGNLSAIVTSTVVLNTQPPTGALVINGGALSSTAISVSLTLSASTSTPASQMAYMRFSNDAISWSSWLTYATTANWLLATSDGLQTVYALFEDTANNVSPIVSSTITLDTSVSTDYGLSIDNGAPFTNQVDVTLTVSAQPGTTQMMLSNDGGFSGAHWQPYASRRAWQITQYGAYVIPRTVYIRFKDGNGNTISVPGDDIILDVNAPTGSVSISGSAKALAPAAASSVVLHLNASDDVSGVGGMLLSNRQDFAGAAWEAYATTHNWTLGVNRTVFVRYRDNAGNVSSTYCASLSATCVGFQLFVPLSKR